MRSRKALQYANSIDDYVRIIKEANNGGYANDWLIGDRKTGEIAYLELGLKMRMCRRLGVRAGAGCSHAEPPAEGPAMRAVLVSEFGGPEQLRPGQAADPVPGPGQVQVAVHAAGVNPVDAGNRADGRWAGLRCHASLAMTWPGSSKAWAPG